MKNEFQQFIQSLPDTERAKLPPSLALMQESSPVTISFGESPAYRVARVVYRQFYKPISQLDLKDERQS